MLFLCYELGRVCCIVVVAMLCMAEQICGFLFFLMDDIECCLFVFAACGLLGGRRVRCE